MNKRDREIAEESYRVGCAEAAKKYGIKKEQVPYLRRIFRYEHPKLFKKCVSLYGLTKNGKRVGIAKEDKINAIEIAVNRSLDEAAKETGFPKQYIEKWLDDATSPNFKGFGRKKIYSPEERNAIVGYSYKHSINSAAKKFGCNRRSVINWRQELKRQGKNTFETTTKETVPSPVEDKSPVVSSGDKETALRKEISAAKKLDDLKDVAKRIGKNAYSLPQEAVERLQLFCVTRQYELSETSDVDEANEDKNLAELRAIYAEREKKQADSGDSTPNQYDPRIAELQKENASLKDALLKLLLKQVGLA